MATATQNISINDKQSDALKAIVKTGKQVVKGNFDIRTVGALEARGLVKTSENSKGLFVIATAKGKKFRN